MISAILSRSRPCSTPTGPGPTPPSSSRSCRPGWDTPNRATPTGISAAPRSCWPPRPSVWKPAVHTTIGAGHDPAGAHPASLLHHPADQPVRGQPAHHRRLPRHLAAAAALRRPGNRHCPGGAGPVPAGHRPDHRVPDPPRNRTRQRHHHPQRPPRGGAFVVSYASYHHPEHAATISRVLAIPAKRAHRTDITYLSPSEVTALLAAPDRSTVAGRRDHALIQVAVTTGMRVSELTALKLTDVHLGTAPHVVCHGKGRKDRITPLDRQTVRVLRELTARASTAETFVFPSRAGTQMSRDAVAARLARHTAAAAQACPSMTRKNLTPHVLRHTAAMRLLAAGIDSSVIALWLGHESIETTQIYLHANMKTKEDALAKTKPTGTKQGVGRHAG